ncbi:hypothetical protein [Lederbergia galactosidilytica]|uniref:Phage-Barnase-EndoU-ColicinE5/D-RelE like nuclease 2 domain-containing protein n=1 Tax=Lederbergia galactosidilytica TaxID=217031 RepID=A0A177ZQ51_9BACI|nr:hypothetical protein [Lederbergia galactosidilytica]OAK70106.1 hypothetical protein ABB05_13090 [Lederbergia galactosidilytica]
MSLEQPGKRTYMWVTKNPLGEEVAVANETYETHIIGDHPDDKARELVNLHVKGVIEEPRYIYYDQKHEENKRIRYIDYVSLEEYNKIQSLVVVVDTDREPNEIVTWSVKSNTRQEKINGGVIYDSRKNTRKSN